MHKQNKKVKYSFSFIIIPAQKSLDKFGDTNVEFFFIMIILNIMLFYFLIFLKFVDDNCAFIVPTVNQHIVKKNVGVAIHILKRKVIFPHKLHVDLSHL